MHHETASTRLAERTVAALLVATFPISTLTSAPVSLGAGLAAILLVPMLGVLPLFPQSRRLLLLMAAALLTTPLVITISLTEPLRSFDFSAALRAAAYFSLAALLLVVLLWSRRWLGDRGTALAFALGSLTQALWNQTTWQDNAWKFALAWPVAVLVLALMKGSRLQLVALIVLAVVSVWLDFRSFAGLCVLAVCLVLWRRRPRSRRVVIRTVMVTALMALLLLRLGTWLALEGYLGESIQIRTTAQTQDGQQSVLLGARPEIGATLGIAAEAPLGLGAGVRPSPFDLGAARLGLEGVAGNLGQSEYVDEYLLTQERIELHSVVADLWLLFGPLGLVTGLVVAVVIVAGMAHQRATGHLNGLLALVGVVALWDLAFSPLSNLNHVIVAVALLARFDHRDVQPAEQRQAHESSATERLPSRSRVHPISARLP